MRKANIRKKKKKVNAQEIMDEDNDIFDMNFWAPLRTFFVCLDFLIINLFLNISNYSQWKLSSM